MRVHSHIPSPKRLALLSLGLLLGACAQQAEPPADGPPSALQAQATGVTAGFGVGSKWDGGFNGTITLSSAGPAVDGWTLKFKPSGDAKVGSVWGAGGSVSTAPDGSVTITPNNWGGDQIPAGGSVQISYGASGSFSGVSACTVNGASCAGGGVTSPPITPAVTPPPAPNSGGGPAASGPVCFYELANYGGASFCAGVDSAWVGAAWNDRISSVKVQSGYQLTLYGDVNYGGASKTLTGNAATLSAFDDLASSFKVAKMDIPPLPGVDLSEPGLKDIAMQLVSSAENSSLDWRAQFRYIEDIGDGRGYTAGIIGFCSGTGDMLDLIQAYADRAPGNRLAGYLPALRQVYGSDSHAGLDPSYPADWRAAADDPIFQAVQESERDRVYFGPALRDAKADGLRALGQFAYYDAAVVHGYQGLRAIRSRALQRATPPAQGGDESAYLNAFLDERVIEMNKEAAHRDTSRIDTAQRVFLQAGNFDLKTPLTWKVYGDSYSIK